MPPSIDTPSRRLHFITVDAETEVIREGISTIAAIRDALEAREQCRIPIVWFVRFQRRTKEYVQIDSPEHFAGPLTAAFDGFALAKAELRQLAARGDEIGWHYHAYNYVRRDDLSHELRLKILEADLVACANELRARHPEFAIRSFRFGWFFVPDDGIYATLERLGITADASIRPGKEGHPVADSPVRYRAPLTITPQQIGGIFYFPFVRTQLIHDYEVVPHDLGWRTLDAEGAHQGQAAFAAELAQHVERVKTARAALTTYQAAATSSS